MVNHKCKFIFVHIPKTGGTSIEAYLYSIFKNNSFKDSNRLQKGGYIPKHKLFAQHATLKQLKNELNVPVDDYFKFTVCRNPFERAVSDYFWCSRLLQTPKPFKDYLLVRNGYEKLNHLESNKGRGDHFYTQFEFIEINGRSKIDFIIRFENLQKDFNIVCGKLKIPHHNLPHNNRSKNRKHYTEYYDDETREIVAKKFAKDIEFFGYKFGE